MTIFNSLGSNYTFRFVLDALFTKNKKQYADNLIEYLEKNYQGKTILLYKAREAITLVLSLFRLPKDSYVAINGFTCYTIYEAIIKAGYIPYYLDIEDDLNFSSTTLERAFVHNPSIKAVIIQNTLGIPCDIEKISALCKKNDCLLIEDLAHSVGTLYDNGKKAGTVGDCVILSFGMDKIIDTVSGGALIVRKKGFEYSFHLEKGAFTQQLKNRLYPLFTFLIRKMYSIGLGKLLHILLKNTRLLSSPLHSLAGKIFHTLPPWHCHFAHQQITQLGNDIRHRQSIAKIYGKKIDSSLQSKKITNRIHQSTNLRFPLFTEKKLDLITFLKKNNIHISDTWYDAPIAPKKCMKKTNYNHQCPHAEKIADHIVNLPTHQSVSEKEALHIASLVNKWLTSL